MGVGEILTWILFGALAGWVASVVVGKDGQLGFVGNVVVGIIGAFIGGVLLPGDSDQFDFGSFIAAVIGAILLLLVVNVFARSTSKPKL